MPDSVLLATPFEQAAGAVQEWLDGPGAAIVARVQHPDRSRHFASWQMDLPHPVVGSQRVTLSLLRDFPASPPQIHLDARLCLTWPHVEESGRFCHGVEPEAGDYINPVQIVQSVLERLQDFWANTEKIAWISAEFQEENLSYWLRFCRLFQKYHGRLSPIETRVHYLSIQGVTEGQVASYFKESKQRPRCQMLVATLGKEEPNSLAHRHHWASGNLVRGDALFVPLSESAPWGPTDWPQTFETLCDLVASVSGDPQTVPSWIEDKAKEGKRRSSLLVILVQKNVCYGYQITVPVVPRLTAPQVIPISLDRVDPDWALARDQQLTSLHNRRQQRVLVLGCGSLGAPLAELLARAGIGELHLVDMELLEASNCSRHVLGADAIGQGKADALAKRLRLSVPGLSVTGLPATAAAYVSGKCKPGDYDLILDCTGEAAVRSMLARYRVVALGGCPVVHAWMEPFCSAAHVVLVGQDHEWPVYDPTDKVNVGQWMSNTRIKLPACGSGFHPYGAADAWQSAGFAAQRVLAVLDNQATPSTIWSWIRSKGFFDSLGVQVKVSPLVPNSTNPLDSIQVSRNFEDVLGEK
ncbi:ThiF family adenylyltransferase [Pseudomonas syringae]|uniref:ThiF family adenylyltransferase n=1 Tax=Pseudomonas syringae TaxID=317 RepID=UPI0018E60AEF|nr:ThiF family adenylyltransferase [Pseudomonas syringae]MBI6710692.1 ThiF family adenylyltransferase [Pseudomonas syringae]